MFHTLYFFFLFLVAAFPQIETHFHNYKWSSQNFYVSCPSYFFGSLGQIQMLFQSHHQRLRRWLGLEAKFMLSKAATASVITETRAWPDCQGLVSLLIPHTSPVLTGGQVTFKKEMIFLQSELLNIQKRRLTRRVVSRTHESSTPASTLALTWVLSWQDSLWGRTCLRRSFNFH